VSIRLPPALLTSLAPAHAAQDGVLLEVGLVVLTLERQPDRGVDQERAEDVEHPARGGDRGGTGQDEDRPQQHRDDDADVEHLVLGQRRNGEPGHDDDEDEQVVDAEAVLRDVAGHELRPGGAARTEQEQGGREQPGQTDVEEHPAGGVLDRHGVFAAGDHGQVEGDDREQTDDGDDPHVGGHSRDHDDPPDDDKGRVRRSLPPE
jgi:hypothetical protein